MRVAAGTERDPVAPVTTRPPDAYYRPQLDGMRAVAVYLVVAFHAGLSAFSGGFIGVDVFFVLSGYLVTQLLLRDFRALGRVDLRRFYSRRFRRLLPAAFVTLVVTAAVYAAVAAPADVHDAIGGFRAAFLYVANWHFISQSNDYFAANVNTNPVVHFWSLAVEEQFYLCWPLLLSGAYVVSRRAGTRQWKTLRLIVAAGFVASLVAALHLSTTNLSRAYYGTDTRAYELLAGALLALTPRIMSTARRRQRLMQALAPVELAVLVLVATSTIHLGAIQRGLAATITTCGLIVTLEVSNAGLVKRALSTASAGYLGRVSYGTYLWHWPVIVIMTQRFHPNGVSLFALTCLLGTALASLSFEILEHRVRVSRLLDRFRSPVIAIGLATSLIGGLVIAPAILRHDRSAASSTAVLGAANGALRARVPNIDWDAVRNDSYGTGHCSAGPRATCILVRGSGPKVLLMGDSQALALVPAFVGLARKYGLTFAVSWSPNCPWLRGLVAVPVDAAADLPKECATRQGDWYDRVIPALDPDMVVLIHRGLDDPGSRAGVHTASGTVLTPARAAFEPALRAAATTSLRALRAPGRKIVILEPIPITPPLRNPLTCLSKATYIDECRYVAPAEPTRLERFYRTVANGTSVYTIDLDRLVCPYLPICDPIVNRTVVKRDSLHITAAYSRTLSAPIAAILVDDGIIPRAPKVTPSTPR